MPRDFVERKNFCLYKHSGVILNKRSRFTRFYKIGYYAERKLQNMSFFKKKQEEAARQENFHQQTLEEIKKLHGELTIIMEKEEQNKKEIKRHNMAMEDFIEAVSEAQENKDASERQIVLLEGRNQAYLNFICCCQEQMELMHRTILGMDSSEETRHQLKKIDEILRNNGLQCGLAVTGNVGDKADYRYCEIIQVRDTDEDLLDGTVSLVYRHGLVADGKVIRMAQVEAYRCQKRRSEVNGKDE